jgi:hypothetical protein
MRPPNAASTARFRKAKKYGTAVSVVPYPRICGMVFSCFFCFTFLRHLYNNKPRKRRANVAIRIPGGEC